MKGYFEEVYTEHGIKWEALPDAMSKTFKGIERKVGGWLSGVGQKVQNTWNNTVWPAIQSLASTFGIELPDIDLGSIFASFNTAYESVKATASTFYTDVKAAFAKDADGKIQLDEALSGMFDAGVKAIEGLLTSAGTLVTDIVGKITGNEEGAKQIGEVFSELFGIGSEVITGVKDGVVAVFGWFLQNGDTVGPIIRDVATAMALFALASPATAIIAAIGALITALTVDWGEFESNYPELVKLFEDLTGLDFTNVATGLTNFQTEFGKLIEWFKSNESVVNFMIAALGAIAYGSGNVVLGTALTMYAAKKEYEEAQKTVENAAEKHSIIKEPKTTVEGDGAGTHQTDNGEQGGGGGHWEERWMPQLRNWRQYPDLDIDGTGGSAGLPGLIGAIQSLIASNQSMKGDVTAAIADGLSGITVTGSISTGNITLDSGVLVGQLTPRLDLKLGSKFGRA
jgi:hypothetical protein